MTPNYPRPRHTPPGFTGGRDWRSAGRAEAGSPRLQPGLSKEPDNVELKAYYHTQRERLSSQLLIQAQQDMDAGRFDAAEATLQKGLSIHPENPRAHSMRNNL